MDIQRFTPQIDLALNVFVFLLVLGVSYQSAQLTLSALTDLPSGSGGSVQSHSANTVKPMTDIQAILNQHLFGEAGQVKVVVEEKPVETIDAPETSLSLVLQGVSVGKKAETSSAIISATKSASGEIYWIGDSVSGQAILSAVYDDRVVIKQNGRLETLRFADEFQSSGMSVSDSTMPLASSSATGTPSHSDMLRSYRSRKQESDDRMNTINNALNDVYRGEFQNYDNLMDQFGSDMEREIESALRTSGLEETSDGMQLGSGAQQNWMNQVGLKYGDIVKSVNGYSVLTLKSDRTALDSVIKSCLARIEVLRGANTFVVTYPFCK